MDVLQTTDDEDATQDILNLLTYGRCSEELATTYSQIASTLHEVNFTGHIDELELLLCSLNNLTIAPEAVVPSVDEILRTAVDRTLSNIGVVISEDTPAHYLAELVDILLKFDSTDIPEVIYNMMQASDDPVEAVLELLSYQGTHEPEDWMSYILSVDENMIKRIKELCRTEMNRLDREVNINIPTDAFKRVTRLLKQRNDTLGAELGVSSLGVGLSLESLYGMHVGRLIDLPVDDAVDNLYSLAAISSESFESAEASLTACLDDLCYDVDQRRKAEQSRIKYSELYRPIFGDDDA